LYNHTSKIENKTTTQSLVFHNRDLTLPIIIAVFFLRFSFGRRVELPLYFEVIVGFRVVDFNGYDGEGFAMTSCESLMIRGYAKLCVLPWHVNELHVWL